MMKQAHRPDLFAWSIFDEARNLDFHGYVWVRDGGNVLFDPVQMSDHDLEHLQTLGGASWILVTNSDHRRCAEPLARTLHAKLAGPAAERDTLGLPCDRWLSDGDELVPGLRVFEMAGSKTPGELAVLIEGHTLVSGDLIRGHRGGRLNLLPDAKLQDKSAACASIRRLLDFAGIEAVLVGDGWPVFRDGHARLSELV